jgi:hypothetical protein
MNRNCPHCHGANVRRSSTPADEITWRNQFFSRYRCRDCMSQFWVISQKTYIVGATLLSAILVAALVVFVVGIMVNPDDSTPGRRRSDAILPSSAATFDTSQRSHS